MEGSPTTNGASVPARPRCVLWHNPEAGAGAIPTVGQLESKLRDRGVEVVRAGSAAAALAELCTLSREGRGPLSVVIVGPERRPGAGAFARALTRYVPHAVVWAFEPGPAPVLRPATPAEMQGWPGGAEPAAEPRVVVTPAASDISRRRQPDEPATPRVRPPLRLSRDPSGAEVRRWAADEGGGGGIPLRAEGGLARPEADKPGGDPTTARQLLTQEELSMLLADDDTDGDHT